jgi:hypothetical protein
MDIRTEVERYRCVGNVARLEASPLMVEKAIEVINGLAE